MTSQSFDSEIVALWDFRFVAAATNRPAAQSAQLLNVVRLMRASLPDSLHDRRSKGPLQKTKMGSDAAGQRQTPILPFTITAKRFAGQESWDQFRIQAFHARAS